MQAAATESGQSTRRTSRRRSRRRSRGRRRTSWPTLPRARHKKAEEVKRATSSKRDKHRCTAQSLRTRCSCLVVFLLLTPVTLCFLLFGACSAYLVAFSTLFGFCECFLQFASVLLQFCVLAFTVMRYNSCIFGIVMCHNMAYYSARIITHYNA